MIIINGNKFAESEDEFIDSLFTSGGTCVGYAKRMKRGIMFFNHQYDIFACCVNNKHNEQFFVSASKRDKVTHYMFGMSDNDEATLGIAGMGYRAKMELASSLF